MQIEIHAANLHDPSRPLAIGKPFNPGVGKERTERTKNKLNTYQLAVSGALWRSASVNILWACTSFPAIWPAQATLLTSELMNMKGSAKSDTVLGSTERGLLLQN